MFDRGLKTHIIDTRSVRRENARGLRTLKADICVLGAGISGVAAALEAAKLGRKVVLVDGAPALGGQAIGSIIGTLIGLYTHGPKPYQITHGIADELIADLDAEGSLVTYRNITVTYQYDELRLARWMERKVQAAGIQAIVGAVLTDVGFANRRVSHIDFATRCGGVRVEAQGFVDASGDATLAWHAGLPVREPQEPIYGTLNFLIEGYDAANIGELSMQAVHEKLKACGRGYGLVRQDGHLMPFPSRGFILANISHFETPLDPLASAPMVFEGRRQADATVEFLRKEFPRIFANARVRAYGNPGIRQTRWIVGKSQLTHADIHSARRHADAVARCAWWVELHNTAELVHWERMPDNHVYTIPLGCMTPADADNIVAAGRCVDGDSHALSAIRVMGPCIAMGTAAAHALDLAGAGSVHTLDLAALQKRLYDNLQRRD
jgi:hypothetical protein